MEKISKDQLLNALYEDQSKMTPAQVERDKTRRLNVLRLGIEVEFYSLLSISETEKYVQNELGFDNWECVVDGSVDNIVPDVPRWSTDIVFNPISTVKTAYGIDEDALANKYLESIKLKKDNAYTIMYSIFNKIRHLVSIISDDLKNINNDEASECINIIHDISSVSFVDMASSPRQAKLLEKLEDLISCLPESISSDYVEMVSEIYRYRDDEFGKLIDAVSDWSINTKSTRYGRAIDRDQAIALYYHMHGKNADSLSYIKNSRTFPVWVTTLYKDHEPDNYQQERDRFGVELRNEKPFSYRSKDEYVDQLSKIMNDSTLSPWVAEDAGNINTVGLHIHVGLSDNTDYTALDFIRLLLNVYQREDEIEALSKRSIESDYIGSIRSDAEQLLNKIGYIANGKSNTESFYQDNDKQLGYNISNITNKGIRTIEFRWADSSISKNPRDLNDYIDFIESLMTSSFTGEPVLKISNGISLQETKRNIKNQIDILVIDTNNNKVLGHLFLESPATIMSNTKSRTKRKKFRMSNKI